MVQLKGMGKRKRRQKEQVRKGKSGLLEVCDLAVISYGHAILWRSVSLAKYHAFAVQWKPAIEISWLHCPYMHALDKICCRMEEHSGMGCWI